MYDPIKIKKLRLGAKVETTVECYKKTNINEKCKGLSCSECVVTYADEHLKLIQEEKRFRCTDCTYTRRLLGIITNDCVICEKIIEKYIKLDFKEVFNNLK